MPILTDPLFYLIAVPAVLLSGVSKGGFGGGMGVLTVPAIALVVPPLQAAAIMLPILCLMDLVGLWAYRGVWDRRNMAIVLPAALAGIALGAVTAGLFEERHISLIIGVVAVAFALNHWLGRQAAAPAGASPLKGGFWGAVAGFTSFVAHAGGPPLSVYLLPQRLDKTVFVGTTVVFFAVVNYVKLVPYGWLGQLHLTNLGTAAVLAPLAPLGVALGVWAHRRVSPVWFYRVIYLLVFVIGLRLIWEGSGAAKLLV